MEPNLKTRLENVSEGKPVIVMDESSADSKAHIVVAADALNLETLHFIRSVGYDTLHVCVEASKLIDMGFKASFEDNAYQVVNSVSIQAKDLTENTSDASYLKTIQTLVEPSSTLQNFKQPGHLFMTQVMYGGVLRRAGHVEAAVDLAKLAKRKGIALIAEIADEKGQRLQGQALVEFSTKHQLPIVLVEELIAYRRETESMIKRVDAAKMPTKYGEFTIVGYENILNKEHHVALIKGDVSDGKPVLIRVHSECLTGDAFGSLRCDCGEQFAAAMRTIEKEGRGILLYMRQEGRGIGLINKIRAYHLQDQGMDTVEANLALGFSADMRDYGIGAQILADLNVKKLKLMTNNPRKLVGLSGYGIEIVERVPIQMNHNEKNEYYLKTKQAKLSHLLRFEE